MYLYRYYRESAQDGKVHSQKSEILLVGNETKARIALALLNHPSIVILDEPMNGLDPQATRDVRKSLPTWLLKAPLSISSHLLSELEKWWMN